MIDREYGDTIAGTVALNNQEGVYAKPKPESPLVSAFEHQRMAIDRLDNSITRLEERLNALLISYPHDSKVMDAEQRGRPQSPFTDSLSASNRQLDSALDRIDLIISSLDV